jgi:hypothetical protein
MERRKLKLVLCRGAESGCGGLLSGSQSYDWVRSDRVYCRVIPYITYGTFVCVRVCTCVRYLGRY